MDKMKWYLDARYGLFIHWGLYAIPAGNWNGRMIPSGTEWIMKNAQIPLDEYAALADSFNPVNFDADEWMRMAKEDFGMRYVVFTAKHHDGFAMYDSHCSGYNVMNTPYGKDVVRQLADACEKHGLVFCVYYSQLQDWAEKDGFGNTWDFGPESEKNFRRYLDEKVKPQLHELLTQYGKIGLVWFDTPYEMPREQCAELADYVRSLQPDCLINGRIGYNLGDYRQTSDNSIPVLAYPNPWEACMTLNYTWGYRAEDKNWKSPKRVVRMLAEIVGKGGNLLLNAGPDAYGNIPPESVEIFRKVGSWLKVNGESIYGAKAAPNFPYQLDWGCFTYQPQTKTLYMHIINWPYKNHGICVVGLTTRVKRATLLKTGEEIRFFQTYETARDEHRLRPVLPAEAPDELDTVIAFELEADPVIQDIVDRR